MTANQKNGTSRLLIKGLKTVELTDFNEERQAADFNEIYTACYFNIDRLPLVSLPFLRNDFVGL